MNTTQNPTASMYNWMPTITLSQDGYVRLTFEQFQQVTLAHLISGMDEGTPAELQKGATQAEITGYTEWLSNTVPAISIGWDWKLHASHHENCYYQRSSEPSGNLMLINAKQLDLGPVKTAAVLGKAIDSFDWQTEVQEFITNRYAP
jgi:hypothetical protein